MNQNNGRKVKRLEFGGALGTTCMVFGLPLTIWCINIACSKDSCTVFQLPNHLPSLNEFFDLNVFFIYIAWFCFQLLLSLIPVGQVATGLPLKSGKCLKYRCNGFFAFVCTLVAFSILVFYGVPVDFIHKKFLAFATTSIIFSSLLSIFLYSKSFTVSENELAEGGNSGVVIYDFFLGRELNPRIGLVDLKFFCELRPGLIGWIVLDLCFVVEALQSPDQPNFSLLLVVVFHTLYVADALWHEEAILTTMDIVHDGFGFMLALGDLAWVPFLYCLQARFLLEHPYIQWSTFGLIAILALNMTGFSIFRLSNSEKNEFRKNPDNPKLSHLKTLPTASGKKLLIDGWWGMSRHPNYMGDLIMALSWSLVTGFQHVIPYFYPIYFLGLLVHRSRRDEINCQYKYGADWAKYCRIVPYKIFPNVY